MSTITQKKKLSKGTWALLILCFVAVIAVAVLAIFGYISLAFLADWLVGVMTFGGTGWVNAVIVLAAPFVFGILVCYSAIKYFVGQKVQAPVSAYTPTGQTLSNQQQQGTETVIS